MRRSTFNRRSYPSKLQLRADHRESLLEHGWHHSHRERWNRIDLQQVTQSQATHSQRDESSHRALTLFRFFPCPP